MENPTTADSGQVSLLLGALLTVGVAIALSLLAASDRLVDRARAQSAADAAALAGAIDGASGASALAAANGADLARFEVRQGGVRVTVELDMTSATAAAGVGAK